MDHPQALSEKVIATETGELANVVVYVVRGLEDTPVPEEPVELLQEGCMFKPHLVVVHAGQTLRIRNADQANHNLNAKPAHGSNPAFNKMQPPEGADIDVVFPRAEIAIPIGCDVHPWMKAHIAVVAHDGWAVSDESGAWSMEVPPGEYLVEGWHEQFGTLKGSVEVGPGEVAELAFSFETKKQKKAP
jgi:plastocyanin